MHKMVSLLNAKWNIQGCETVIFEGEKEMPTTKYKPFYYSCITRLEKEKSDTSFFGSKFFIFAFFSSRFWESFIVSWYSSKKVPRSFFSLWGKKLPCELILNFFLGLYLNSGTGLSLIFLVKVLMMVILCLSIYSHWFYPKEMEIIGIFTCTHFDAHAF